MCATSPPGKLKMCPLTKGGVAGPDAPKMQALPEGAGGGSDPCWIFVKDLSTCTEGPQR